MPWRINDIVRVVALVVEFSCDVNQVFAEYVEYTLLDNTIHTPEIIDRECSDYTLGRFGSLRSLVLYPPR